jgi:hypothetical protein
MAFGQKKEELPGLSNNGPAQSGGYPSSGAMQPGGASPKALPPQRAGEPYQATPPPNAGSARGTLNGSAVVGSQFKTTPQPMSSGVASYVGIPQNPNISQNPAQFKPPVGSPPGANVFQGQTKASYFYDPDTGQESGSNAAPVATPPPSQTGRAPAGGGYNGSPGGQGTGPDASGLPVASTPSWMPNNTAQFGAGSPWANAQAAQFALKQQQNLQSANTAAGMRGRGGSVQAAGAGYQNLLGDVAFAGEMADVQQHAKQQDYQNQMQYADALAKTKLQLMAAARDMGMTLAEEQFNTMAAESLAQYGPNAGPGSTLDLLNKGAAGAGSSDKMSALSAYINDGDGNTIASALEGLSAQEIKSVPAEWWDKALSESWGSDDDRIRAVMVKYGIPIPN